jgi:sarcosine oxidase, subunit alpha
VKRVQVAVVGGGPAGWNASRTAGELGAHVVQFDEQVFMDGRSAVDCERVGDVYHPAVDYRYGSAVWGLFEGNILGVVRGSESLQFQADQVILATGSTDLPCPFPGGSLPGVFTSRALWTMLTKWGVMPGRRFVVVGGGDDNEADAQIEDFGGEIIARVPATRASKLVAIGERGVEAVEIGGVRLEADVVVIEVGRQPDIELALMAECTVGYCQMLGGFVPVRHENLRTSRSSILVAGDIAGICESSVAVAEGKFAGISAAHALGLVDDSMLEHERALYVEATGDRSRLASQTTATYVQV